MTAIKSDQAELAEIEEITDDISDISWMDSPVIVIFVILIGLVAAQFFTRYVLNDSLAWTEEVSRYFLVLLCFVGAITCVRKGSHIYLEFFYLFLPRWMIKPVAVSAEVITASFFGWLGVLGLELAYKTKAQYMASVPLPKSLIYYTVTASCFLMALFAFIRIIQILRRDAGSVAAEKLDNFG
ncbi:TRAP transporter small permease [Ahrensia marina]|uniref:TRAP transporter small permease n=1 Tax=Ahrensia marina TaxID=1514904 RepID=UPI0006B62504|nr:TRAP transporter small permease [Ahrensia marina]